MNVSTPLKAVCLFTLTTIVAACSSTPKVPLPEPKLPERVALVEGHTDAIGDENFNQSLSVDRANAIRSALLAQGISDSRIKPTGMGESQPIADNDTDTGRQNNRRVEIIFKLKEEIQ